MSMIRSTCFCFRTFWTHRRFLRTVFPSPPLSLSLSYILFCWRGASPDRLHDRSWRTGQRSRPSLGGESISGRSFQCCGSRSVDEEKNRQMDERARGGRCDARETTLPDPRRERHRERSSVRSPSVGASGANVRGQTKGVLSPSRHSDRGLALLSKRR